MSTSEKLDIPIGLDLTEVRAALGSLRQLQVPIDIVDARLGIVNTTVTQLGDNSTVVTAAMRGGWESWHKTISDTVSSIALMHSELSHSAATAAIDRLNNRTLQLRSLVTQTGDQFSRMSQASGAVKLPALPASGSGSGLGTILQVGAVAAQVSAMSQINRAITHVKKNVAAATSTFNTFRMAKTAPKVDPGFNVVDSAVKKTTTVVATGIDNVRKAADASLDGWKDSAVSAAKGANQVSKSLDETAATVAKYDWHVKAGIKSLQIMKTVFRPLRGTLQGYEDKLRSVGTATTFLAKKSNDAALTSAAAAAKLSARTYVLTGTFEKGEGSAGLFAGALKWMAFPARMLFREFEGGKRVVNAFMTVTSAVTSPVRLVTNSFMKAKRESELLNKSLEGKSRTTKVLARSWFALYQGLKPVYGTLRLTYTATSAVVGGLKRMAGPVAGVTKGAYNAAKNLLMFGRTSVKAGSDAAQLAASAGPVKASLVGIANASKKAAGGLASVAKGPVGMLKGILGSSLAMGALVTATVAWGGATAIATETATTKFGTLLSDMGQGKALIKEITSFSAATPFSNEALRESAGLLLAAQIPADAITAKLTTLGDIAAGTSKPIEEFATVFSKVANTGKLGLGEINQFAERGVPLYDALQSTLGVSRAEMLKMVSDGQLGFSHLEAALGSLTTGTGVFAGGMAAQSQTIAGLWSTLKDNIGIALEGIVGVFLEAGKPIMSGIITLVQGISATIERLKPVFEIWAGAVISLFTGIWTVGVNAFRMIGEVATGALALIGINGGLTFDGLLVNLVTFFTLAKYSFENFPLLAAIAFYSTGLSFVNMANDIGYFFTATLPAYMSWFGDNWALLFLDAAALVGTFAENIKNNIVNAWTAIWDYITGKSDALNFDWTPLTDGFRKTIADLPDIPERALSQLEVQMSADISNMKSQFADGAADAVALALEKLKPVEAEKLKATTAPNTGIVEDSGAGDAKTKQRTNFSVDSLDRGSTEALKAIYANQSRDKTPEQQLGQAKQQTKLLEKIANKPSPALAIAGPA